ncbi:8-oxoguanine deaminase, partial [Arthrobacter deserti]|nr:8-oxoguanine deaminase [Arthrobacter deserti]
MENCDTLVVNGYIVIDRHTELDGGWIALSGGRVAAAGGSADPRPWAGRVVDAGGRLVTPGLVDTHHHMYQNLTRSFGPAINGSLFD